MRVSIVIPCLNAAETVTEVMNSLQGCNNLGAISCVFLVDDCSNDGSAAIARAAWTANTPLVTHSFETTRGQWSATNYGLSELAADSDWCFILHADDIVKENWIALYLKAFETAPESVGSVCSSYDVWFKDTGRVIPGEEDPHRPSVHVPGDWASVKSTLAKGCWWHISGCAIRVSSYRNIGPFEPTLPMLGDWDWMLRALSTGHGIWYLPRSTLIYRQFEQSVSARSFRTGQDIRDRLTIIRRYVELGYLSKGEHRTFARNAMRQIGRRTLLRLARRDPIGLRAHAALLREIAFDYLRG